MKLRELLAKHGLDRCMCGHPSNNHFGEQNKGGCAHCECESYRRLMSEVEQAIRADERRKMNQATKKLLNRCRRDD